MVIISTFFPLSTLWKATDMLAFIAGDLFIYPLCLWIYEHAPIIYHVIELILAHTVPNDDVNIATSLEEKCKNVCVLCFRNRVEYAP